MNTLNGINQNQNHNAFFAPISLSQILTTSSKIDIVFPTTQDHEVGFPFGVLAEVPMTPLEYDPDLTKPRVAGAGKGRILKVAPDFDAPLQW